MSAQDRRQMQTDPQMRPLLEALQHVSFTAGHISVQNINGEGITVGHGSTTYQITIVYNQPPPSPETPKPPLPDFDPMKFIDRKDEIKLFQQLLQFDSTARILIIRDGRGNGKSHLMRYFRHCCNEQRIPASLVDFRQFPNLSPPVFIEEIVRDFARAHMHISLPTYNFAKRQLRKRIAPDWSRDLGAIGLAEVLSPGKSSGDLVLKRTFEEVVVDGFFEDLRAHCCQHPAVLLLDSFEQCSAHLQEWIEASFVRDQFLQIDQAPGNLLLVIAGVKVPISERNQHLPIIKSRSKLSSWKQGDFQQWLGLNGYSASRQHARFYYDRFATRTMSLLDMLSAIQIFEQQLSQYEGNDAKEQG